MIYATKPWENTKQAQFHKERHLRKMFEIEATNFGAEEPVERPSKSFFSHLCDLIKMLNSFLFGEELPVQPTQTQEMQKTVEKQSPEKKSNSFSELPELRAELNSVRNQLVEEFGKERAGTSKMTLSQLDELITKKNALANQVNETEKMVDRALKYLESSK